MVREQQPKCDHSGWTGRVKIARFKTLRYENDDQCIERAVRASCGFVTMMRFLCDLSSVICVFSRNV